MAELNKSELLSRIQDYGQKSREFGRAMMNIGDHAQVVAAEQAANAAFDEVLFVLFPLARVQTQERVDPMERASRELDSATDAQDNVEV